MGVVKLRALALASVAICALATPAWAQNSEPPIRTSVDENGVDLVSGNFVVTVVEGAIGNGPGAVSLSRTRLGSSNWIDNWSGGLFVDQAGGVTTTHVLSGSTSEDFTQSGGTYVSVSGDGATLTNGGGTFTFTSNDGTKTYFSTSPAEYPISGFACSSYSSNPTCAIPTSIVKPNGTTFTLDWTFTDICPQRDIECTGGKSFYRLNSVTSSAGYRYILSYKTNVAGRYNAPQSDWYKKTGVSFSNINDTSMPGPAITYPTPSSDYPDFTDAAGGTWHFTGGVGLPLTSIQRPGDAAASTTIAYNGTGGSLSSVTRNGVTTNYSRVVSGNQATTTITDASSNSTVVTADLVQQVITRSQDALGNVTVYGYDSSGRLNEIDYPEGNKTLYAYDARGNRTSTTQRAKPSTGGTDIVTSAGFQATCGADLSCNEPQWTKDANGSQTDYTYNATTGAPLTVTAPAAASGIRPQSRFTYSTVSGSSLLTGISSCQTLASCAGGADEVKATIAYNSNMLPTSVTRSAGDGSLSATTSVTYDSVGNVVTATNPLGAVSRFAYDANRHVVASMAPDPDGAGPRGIAARLWTYDANGQQTVAQIGTLPSQATGWGSFTALQQLSTTYDANGRKVQDATSGGGVTFGVTQYAYDAMGRMNCIATRMNPAAFGSAPGACQLGTQGSDGPDRLRQFQFDALGRVTLRQEGNGTNASTNEAQIAYTNNGQIASLTDANGNVTAYTYDGFDRPSRTCYQIATQATCAGSPSDYEQFTYDSNSRITSRRLRDGNTITLGYDALNRVTSKAIASKVADEFDISYQYDLVGRLTQALDANTHVTNIAYDALGRRISEQSNWTTRTSQYDAAGRRTRLAWGDGFYVTYEYDSVGGMTAIRENGSAVLAAFGYDDLGRRTSLSRGNGVTTTYSYNAASQLASLGLDLAGTENDLSLGFTYNAARQITSRTSSNDAYAWPGAANVDRNYGNNGLNQYTSSGGVALGYDARGNLTSSGSNSYTYTAENRLATASGGYTMTYDPLGRYHWIANGGITWMQYDGDQIIEELAGNAVVQRRYVFGPAGDEPLVWYEGSGTSDKRYLVADERGSVIAVTDGSGNALNISSYDEYGIPNATAPAYQGRFGYTGQAWLPSLGMWYYKARIYSPTLGRFMQTDPIGYGDGLSWYNYVGSDPANRVDPSGLDEITVTAVQDIVVTARHRITFCESSPLSELCRGTILQIPTTGSGNGTGVVPQRPTAPAGGTAPQNDDNHGCAAGTTYKAMDANGQPICQAPPAPFRQKWTQKQQHDDVCKLLTLGGFATLPTSGANQLNKLRSLGRLAPFVEDAATLSDPAAILLGGMAALEGCY